MNSGRMPMASNFLSYLVSDSTAHLGAAEFKIAALAENHGPLSITVTTMPM